jgi:hypothetical protein
MLYTCHVMVCHVGLYLLIIEDERSVSVGLEKKSTGAV